MGVNASQNTALRRKRDFLKESPSNAQKTEWPLGGQKVTNVHRKEKHDKRRVI